MPPTPPAVFVFAAAVAALLLGMAQGAAAGPAAIDGPAGLSPGTPAWLVCLGALALVGVMVHEELDNWRDYLRKLEHRRRAVADFARHGAG